MVSTPLNRATEIFRQKMALNHQDDTRMAIFEVVIWQISPNQWYPEGIKYRAWLSENGETVFGFDNHKPKGPHLHIGDLEVAYVFKGIDQLKHDILAMIQKVGFLYET